MCSVNALGANDDLIFDGEAIAAWPSGARVAAPRWNDAPLLVDCATPPEATAPAAGDDPNEERWHALRTGIEAY
ncbi:MAG: NAD+ synthase, partial [Phycisphaerales bacterium]